MRVDGLGMTAPMSPPPGGVWSVSSFKSAVRTWYRTALGRRGL